MRKLNWLFMLLLLALVPALQSCDNDDDGYSIGDIGWDWATVRTTGGGGYYLEGDQWGTIWPLSTAIPWFRPVDGERIVAYFNPLQDNFGDYDVAVKMEGVREVLTKKVEDLTAVNEADFGNDPIVIYQGDLWLGGKYMNLVFEQNIPHSKKHRISLVKNTTVQPEEDGYVHLELRYNTYKDESGYRQWAYVSYDLTEFYPTAQPLATAPAFKGFKVKINSKKNGERVLTLDINDKVAVPEKAKKNADISTMLQ